MQVNEPLLAQYLRQLNALRYETIGLIEALVVSPCPDQHCFVSSLRVIPKLGIQGEYPGKQWWQGRRVPGRQISAVNAEVLDVLEIPYHVPGDNLIIQGIDLARFQPGEALRIGDAILIATQTSHRPCAKLAQRTSLTKMKAISSGQRRGTLFDAYRPATVCVGDAVERILLPELPAF